MDKMNGNLGSEVDGFKNTFIVNREHEGPSSGLDILEHDNNIDSESTSSGKYEMYMANPESNESLGEVSIQIIGENVDNKVDYLNMANRDGECDLGKSVSKESLEVKLKSDGKLADTVPFEKSESDITSGKFIEIFSGSRPDSVASSSKSGTPSKDKDPARKEKEKEREDRIRQTQQKLAEERQKKIEEMREQQRLAQENREKQLESRRKKIEDLKKREEERRKQVEERRRTQEDNDKAKKEAILSKAKERLTRYEQWKSHGRKGGRRHVLGFGSRTPREVCLPLDARRSSSQSTLRRSPNSSDYDSYFNRRAVSASSVVRRHCCIDINKLTQGTGYHGESPPSKQFSMSMSVLYHKSSPQFSSSGTLNTHGIGVLKPGAESMIASAPSTKHKSSVNLTGVKMRDPNKTSTRKPRPSSVATSMPSFVAMESDSLKSSRSKSTDRGPVEHTRGRVTIKGDDEKADGKERKAVILPRPYDKKKIEERQQEVLKKAEEKKEKEKEKERMTKSENIKESEERDKLPARMSKSFVDRNAILRHSPTTKKELASESSPVKAKLPVKDKSKGHKDLPKTTPKAEEVEDKKEKDDSSQSKSVTPKSFAPSGSPLKVMHTIQPEETKDTAPAECVPEKTEISYAEEPVSKPAVSIDDLEAPFVLQVEESNIHKTAPKVKLDVKWSSEPKAAQKIETKVTSKTDKEHEMDEYKAKLAEKRRLAREKAEREAEIERIRQEEEQRRQEERQQLEEERQRREEEQALHLAIEARKLEEDRLQKAIEAEERRKHDEAERLEHERISREESDRKTKEELERRERDMAERARREEEERTERKKRLEMIMKRVKTEGPGNTPEKARTESPTRVASVTSGRSSQVSSEDEKVDEDEKEDRYVHKSDSHEIPKFKSPLLQKMTEIKAPTEDTGAPKFKSPLLQSIMGKTKIGARLSGTKLDEMDKSTDNLTQSISSENLSEKKKTQKVEQDIDKFIEIRISNGLQESDKCDTEEMLQEVGTLTTHSDVDAHDTGVKTVIEVDVGKPYVIDSWTENAAGVKVSDSQTTADSALSLSFYGVSSPQNGDIHIAAKEFIDLKDLVDSSISVCTVDSFGSSQSGSIGGSFQGSQAIPPSESTHFEEIINLSRVPAKSFKTQPVSGEPMQNGGSVFNLDDADCSHEASDSEFQLMSRPIIAFEEHATRGQDIPDILS